MRIVELVLNRDKRNDFWKLTKKIHYKLRFFMKIENACRFGPQFVSENL